MSNTVAVKIGSLEAELKILKSELGKENEEKEIERRGDFSFQEIKEAELKI